MKTLLAFAGNIPKSFLITTLILLNIVNIFIINESLWLTIAVSAAILLIAAALIMHTLQKFDEGRAEMEATQMKRD